MNYTTELEISNLKGSSKEYMQDNFPNLIVSLEEQIKQLDNLEKIEAENLENKSSNPNYKYFRNNKWAHFCIGLYTIQETKKRLKKYIKKLEKDLGNSVKKNVS